MNNETIKNCKSCTYYVPHYTVENLIARKTNYGHCKKSLKKKLLLCKHWTEKRDDINIEVSFKQVLKKIYNQLEKIAFVVDNMDII